MSKQNQKTDYLKITSSHFPDFIYCGLKELAPYEVHVRRTFPIFNIIFVKRGKLSLIEGGKKFTISSGEWFIQTPDILHYGIEPSSEITAFYFIHFTSDSWMISDTATLQSPSLSVLDTGSGIAPPQTCLTLPMQYPCTKSTQKLLQELIQNYGKISPIQASSHFQRILDSMLQNKSDSSLSDIESQIIYYINQHFLDSDFNQEKLCKTFGYTRQYLTNLIRKKTGKSFIEYKHFLVIDYAKKQLISGNVSLSELALNLGYNDLSAFSHMFKREVGISPKEFFNFISQKIIN